MPKNTLAIIPAKKFSQRIPSKNILEFDGKPLFMHSVQYARNEGIDCIVSTDSPEIIDICIRNNVRYIQETVNEVNLLYCVKNVIDNFPTVQTVAVLQPTSPFRCPILLRKMVEKLHNGNFHSVYTSDKLKVIGDLDGEFQFAYRDQDTNRWFRQFDGNILVVDVAKMKEHNALFSQHSLFVEEKYPYILQADVPEQFALLQSMTKMPAFKHALPYEKKPSIVIVSNKAYYLRNYSKFIDSCDIVVRVNNMPNYDTGLAGKKTDVAVVGTNPLYLSRTPDFNHINIALNVPLLYLHYVQSACAIEFLSKKPKGNVMFLSSDVKQEGAEWTTFGRAVKIMHELYPDVKLKLLGDKHVASRSDATLCQLSTEDSVLDTWEQQGFIEYVLEEEERETYQYSEPIDESNHPYYVRAELVKDYNAFPGEEIECLSPQWSSTVKIVDGICIRKDNTWCGYIKSRDEDKLTIWWDGMGEEPFVRNEEGSYISVIPSGKSLWR